MSAWWGWPVASIMAIFGGLLFVGGWEEWKNGGLLWPTPFLLGALCVFPLAAACAVSL